MKLARAVDGDFGYLELSEVYRMDVRSQKAGHDRYGTFRDEVSQKVCQPFIISLDFDKGHQVFVDHFLVVVLTLCPTIITNCKKGTEASKTPRRILVERKRVRALLSLYEIL